MVEKNRGCFFENGGNNGFEKGALTELQGTSTYTKTAHITAYMDHLLSARTC